MTTDIETRRESEGAPLADAPEAPRRRPRLPLIAIGAIAVLAAGGAIAARTIDRDATTQTAATQQAPPPSTTSLPTTTTTPAHPRLEHHPIEVGTVTIGSRIKGFREAAPMTVETTDPLDPLAAPRSMLNTQFVIIDPPFPGDDPKNPSYSVSVIDDLTEADLEEALHYGRLQMDFESNGYFVTRTVLQGTEAGPKVVWTDLGFSPHPGTWVAISGREIDDALLFAIANSIR